MGSVCGVLLASSVACPAPVSAAVYRTGGGEEPEVEVVVGPGVEGLGEFLHLEAFGAFEGLFAKGAIGVFGVFEDVDFVDLGAAVVAVVHPVGFTGALVFVEAIALGEAVDLFDCVWGESADIEGHDATWEREREDGGDSKAGQTLQLIGYDEVAV